MSYHDWVCPECGMETTQPDWIVEVFCWRTMNHKRRKVRLMRRVETMERSQ